MRVIARIKLENAPTVKEGQMFTVPGAVWTNWTTLYPKQDAFTRYHCMKHNLTGFDPCALCKMEREQEAAEGVDVAGEVLNTIPTGWVCPRCSLVHAPHINRCTCKPAA